MKIGTQYPRRIVTNAAEAHTVMQGSQRSWSYDDGEGAPAFQSDVGITSAFTRWVNNRGQGTHKVAFRFGGSTIAFGGVTWHQAFNVGGNNAAWGAANGMWVAFSTAANGGTYCNHQFPYALPTGQGVDAFSGFCWDVPDKKVWVGGLVVGRSYCFQIVMADNRGPGVDNRQVNVVPIQGMGDTNTSGYQRFAFGTEVKYTVVSVRFIATADVVGFRPDVRNNDGSDAGPQINALNILENVLPEGKMFFVANDGNDDNDGMSPETPWASISRVHERAYKPGDCILFKRGHKWTGQQLAPSGSGSAGQPIVLGAYGQGAHPLFDVNAAADSAVSLSGQPYWIVEGLEVTNWVAGTQFVTSWTWDGSIWNASHQNASWRFGIKAHACSHLVVRDCYVHDVLGLYLDRTGARQTGGIYISGSNVDDVLVEGNTVDDMMGVGILVRAADLHPDTAAAVWEPQVMTNVVVRGNTVHGSAADNILVIVADAPLIEHNHSGFSGLTACWPSQIAGLWMQFAFDGTQQYNHSYSSRTWLGSGESYDAQGLGVDYNMRGEAFINHNFTHDNFGGMLLNYNYNGDGAVVTCHHNISLCEPRLTSGRPENHWHDMLVAPDDDYLLHWGAGNLRFRYNAVNATSMASATGISESIGSLWWPMAKPANDATGQSANPLFTDSPGRVILRDTMALYDVGDRDPNRAIQAGQTEPRWYGVLRNQATKYLRLGTASTFEMGGGGNPFNAGENTANFDYRVMRVNGYSGLLAINANLASGVARPLTIRVNVRSNKSPGVDENWLAFCLKNSAFAAVGSNVWVNDPATRYGLLFRSGGHATQKFTDGNYGGGPDRPWAGARGPTFFHVLELVLTNAAGDVDASPFTGASTRVRVYCDGLLLDDTILPTPLTALHFGLNSIVSDWRISSIEVFEAAGLLDRFRAYEGLVPQAGSPLLNAVPNGTDPLPLGTEDFFGNASDATPNRGAIEVTTLAGYVQTATRIEIRGRYRIARPASGSLDYNYDAIIRDQNNRVIAQAVTWSSTPLPAGVTLDTASGVVTVASTATLGRFALKASYGGVEATFPVEII